MSEDSEKAPEAPFSMAKLRELAFDNKLFKGIIMQALYRGEEGKFSFYRAPMYLYFLAFLRVLSLYAF